MKGYVYVLTNEAMPGLVKIGRSKTAAAGRANTMYRGDTGVPLPFDIAFECLFEDCIAGEQFVHEQLDACRINPNREFFKIDEIDATVAVMGARAYEIDHIIAHADISVRDDAVLRLADSLNTVSPCIATAISDYLTPDELRPALERYESRVAAYKLANTNRIHVVVDNLEENRPPEKCFGCGNIVIEYAEINTENYCEPCFRAELSAATK